MVFVGVSVALEVVIALAVALVIDDDRVGLSRVTRVLLLVPWGVPPVVNGLLWAFIFNTRKAAQDGLRILAAQQPPASGSSKRAAPA